MTPEQLGLLLILLIIVIYSIYSIIITHKETVSSVILWGFVTFILFILVFVQATILNQDDDTCPQYEKVENVYKLKYN
jgi:uncharacterized membrane protein YjfL (UPF0719 family)